MAKVLVSMPEKFLSEIDKYAEQEQRTRSELVREALRSYIRRSNVANTKLNEKRASILEDLLD